MLAVRDSAAQFHIVNMGYVALRCFTMQKVIKVNYSQRESKKVE